MIMHKFLSSSRRASALAIVAGMVGVWGLVGGQTSNARTAGAPANGLSATQSSSTDFSAARKKYSNRSGVRSPYAAFGAFVDNPYDANAFAGPGYYGPGYGYGYGDNSRNQIWSQ